MLFQFVNIFRDKLKKCLKCESYRCPSSSRCSHVARAVEVAEVIVGRLAVPRRELVRENFRAHPVYGARVVAVGYGCVSGFHPPHRFAQTTHLRVGTALVSARMRTYRALVPWRKD